MILCPKDYFIINDAIIHIELTFVLWLFQRICSCWVRCCFFWFVFFCLITIHMQIHVIDWCSKKVFKFKRILRIYDVQFINIPQCLYFRTSYTWATFHHHQRGIQTKPAQAMWPVWSDRWEMTDITCTILNNF